LEKYCTASKDRDYIGLIAEQGICRTKLTIVDRDDAQEMLISRPSKLLVEIVEGNEVKLYSTEMEISRLEHLPFSGGTVDTADDDALLIRIMATGM
jgi:hypothetical protein